jgi:hypothetical protein
MLRFLWHATKSISIPSSGLFFLAQAMEGERGEPALSVIVVGMVIESHAV